MNKGKLTEFSIYNYHLNYLQRGGGWEPMQKCDQYIKIIWFCLVKHCITRFNFYKNIFIPLFKYQYLNQFLTYATFFIKNQPFILAIYHWLQHSTCLCHILQPLFYYFIFCKSCSPLQLKLQRQCYIFNRD